MNALKSWFTVKTIKVVWPFIKPWLDWGASQTSTDYDQRAIDAIDKFIKTL